MINVKENIIACINYIENNLYNKISLDDICVNTDISKFYLHRMFKSLTGESLMEYVQGRKLTASINELVNTNKRIIDIALDYGFQYEQSYIRAFKKLFNHTPLKIRTSETLLELKIKEKINPKDILCVDKSITYKPHFVFMKNFYLVGDRHTLISKSGDKAANNYGKNFFYENKHLIKNAINPNIYFGYTDWNTANNGITYYMPSVQVPNLSSIPKGMTGVSIPSNKYVVFRFIGFFSPKNIRGRDLGRLLVQLYKKWIINSGYNFADTYRLEYIDNSLCKDNYCELDILQPII